jgi:ATP-binding cassette, subfamily B, bacterial
MSNVHHGPDVEDEHGAVETPVVATMRRGMAAVPELRDGLGVTVALAAFNALGRLVVPIITGRAIDRGFKRGTAAGALSIADRVDLDLIVRLVVIGLVAVLVTTFSGQLSRYRLNVRAEKALASLRRQSVARILRLSIHQHSEMRRGVLVARLTSDVETLSQFFSWGAVGWVLDTTIVVVVGVAMLAIDWRLALVAYVLSLPMLIAFAVLQARIVRAYGIARGYLGDYLGRVSEIVGAAALIRAYGAEHDMRVATYRAIDGRRRSYMRAGMMSSTLSVSSEGFSALIMSATLLYALHLGPGSGLTAGQVVTFALLVSRLVEPFGELAEIVDQTQLAASGMGRILDLIDLPDDVAPSETPLPLPSGGLSVRLVDVGFAYASRAFDQQREAFSLEQISLDIAAGETVAIVGPTGSGKSTLAKLIVRTADPTSGRVEVGGIDISHVDPAELRQRVQLVPQEPFLFNTTIAENVAMAARATSGRTMSPVDIDRVLDEVGLRDWLDTLDDGAGTVVGERGGLLSAGERQLVALARARAANPAVLVLDEATSSVDASTEARLASTIEALSEGRTTVVIAHRLTTVMRADRVIVVEAGRVVEVGTPAQLSERPGGVFAGLVAAWERAGGVPAS